jgi:hypothetical protein
MYNAKIIVTVNPANWEGDFRLWEALASGALVFVDPLFVPHPHPLLHEEHVIYFSNHNQADLIAKLDYYLQHSDEANRIARNGYLHSMKFHRTVSMMDYVLRTAHEKSRHSQRSFLQQSGSGDDSKGEGRYVYTGQYLHQEVKMQAEMIKKCNQPGYYLEDQGKRLTC